MHSSILGFILVSIQIFNSNASTPNSRLNFFDIDLLRNAAEDKKGNVMLSPASLKSTLALLLEGAEGTTASELKSALRVSPDKEDYRDELSFFVKSLQANSSNVFVQNTNALFVSKKIKLRKGFETVTQKLYHSEIGRLDFGEPKTAADLINAWVNTKTKGLIPSIVEEVQLSATTEVVMANALYFRGTWKNGFDTKLTHGECFYNNEICTNVAMMELQAELNYAFVDNLRAHALELPYKGDRYSMILLVPQDRDSGLVLFRDLPYVGLPQILDMMYPNDVILSMPKFDVDYNEDLVGVFKKMHITSLFSTSANLSGVYESGNGPYVNNIYHSVHMKVDEAGTVAAAASASFIVPLINNQVRLQVDRPFLFFIRDNNLGMNLFEGKIEEPTKFVNYGENGNKDKPQVPEKSKPVPAEPFSNEATKTPTPSSQQSFHEANPNYDHGGPYQPLSSYEVPQKSTVYRSSNSNPVSTSSTTNPLSSTTLPSAHIESNDNENHQTKRTGGISGFFKKIGSYFDI